MVELNKGLKSNSFSGQVFNINKWSGPGLRNKEAEVCFAFLWIQAYERQQYEFKSMAPTLSFETREAIGSSGDWGHLKRAGPSGGATITYYLQLQMLAKCFQVLWILRELRNMDFFFLCEMSDFLIWGQLILDC